MDKPQNRIAILTLLIALLLLPSGLSLSEPTTDLPQEDNANIPPVIGPELMIPDDPLPGIVDDDDHELEEPDLSADNVEDVDGMVEQIDD